MSKTDEIIGEIDPNQKKCASCHKYKDTSKFNTNAIASGKTSNICDKCWRKMGDPRTYRR